MSHSQAFVANVERVRVWCVQPDSGSAESAELWLSKLMDNVRLLVRSTEGQEAILGGPLRLLDKVRFTLGRIQRGPGAAACVQTALTTLARLALNLLLTCGRDDRPELRVIDMNSGPMVYYVKRLEGYEKVLDLLGYRECAGGLYQLGQGLASEPGTLATCYLEILCVEQLFLQSTNSTNRLEGDMIEHIEAALDSWLSLPGGRKAMEESIRSSNTAHLHYVPPKPHQGVETPSAIGGHRGSAAHPEPPPNASSNSSLAGGRRQPPGAHVPSSQSSPAVSTTCNQDHRPGNQDHRPGNQDHRPSAEHPSLPAAHRGMPNPGHPSSATQLRRERYDTAPAGGLPSGNGQQSGTMSAIDPHTHHVATTTPPTSGHSSRDPAYIQQPAARTSPSRRPHASADAATSTVADDCQSGPVVCPASPPGSFLPEHLQAVRTRQLHDRQKMIKDHEMAERKEEERRRHLLQQQQQRPPSESGSNVHAHISTGNHGGTLDAHQYVSPATATFAAGTGQDLTSSLNLPPPEPPLELAFPAMASSTGAGGNHRYAGPWQGNGTTPGSGGAGSRPPGHASHMTGLPATHQGDQHGTSHRSEAAPFDRGAPARAGYGQYTFESQQGPLASRVDVPAVSSAPRTVAPTAGLQYVGSHGDLPSSAHSAHDAGVVRQQRPGAGRIQADQLPELFQAISRAPASHSPAGYSSQVSDNPHEYTTQLSSGSNSTMNTAELDLYGGASSLESLPSMSDSVRCSSSMDTHSSFINKPDDPVDAMMDEDSLHAEIAQSKSQFCRSQSSGDGQYSRSSSSGDGGHQSRYIRSASSGPGAQLGPAHSGGLTHHAGGQDGGLQTFPLRTRQAHTPEIDTVYGALPTASQSAAPAASARLDLDDEDMYGDDYDVV